MYLDVDVDLEAGAVSAPLPASAVHQAATNSTQPVPSRLGGWGGTAGGASSHPPPPPPPHADAATSTSNLPSVPPPGPLGPGLGLGQSTDQHRSVRDVFAAEALDPRLRSDLTQQLRGLLGNSDDTAIKRSAPSRRAGLLSPLFTDLYS